MSEDNRIRWIQKEHEKVDALIAALRAQVAAVPKAGLSTWIGDTQRQFEHLRAHLIRHMALEESDGYLVEVIERRPTLSKEVDRLEHEHREMAKIMESVHQVLSSVTPEDPLLLEDCCSRIRALLGYVERHEDFENLLVTSVFSRDIGSKD